MIFVILGSQKFQFNRLLEKIDELIEEKVINEPVFAQIGASTYLPKNYTYKAFLNRDEFEEMVNKSDVVITHGGTGAIIGAVKKNKKVIAVPRLAKYGEHVDDHQIQLLKEFNTMGIIEVSYTLEELAEKYTRIFVEKYVTYASNTNNIILDINKYLNSNI